MFDRVATLAAVQRHRADDALFVSTMAIGSLELVATTVAAPKYRATAGDQQLDGRLVTYSKFTTTVSPPYASEVRYTHEGCGLGQTFIGCSRREVPRSPQRGGLCDYAVWNPEVDPWIARRYSPAVLDGEYVNQHALRQRFLLRDQHKPIVCYVGRLDFQ